MDRKNAAEDEASLKQAIKALGSQIEQVSGALDRMEGRLDALYDECQRIGATTQRSILRQEKISQSLDQLERSLKDL